MKTFAIALAILLSVFTANASSTVDKKKTNSKRATLKAAITKQINRHFFYPVSDTEESVEGFADVTFQVLPEGNVQVLMIQTKNALVRKFIERQAAKMKVDKDQVVVGEIFQYRLTFKAKE
jgi:hypothetical protein